ncbi:putative endo-1,3(4)-beta-glucanase [Phyllosticta capitalensis]|uniref:concanavalin A-like lectin/glucanase domain-containing protein n=1 Tax=Phyllosticta capitalensis TaxID=121624 RepID=UPI003131CE5E
MISTLFLALAAGSWASSGSWVVQHDYTPDIFFDMFDFYDGQDPTNGFVQYVDSATANSSSLTEVTSENQIYIGVDHTSTSTSGRSSVRLNSTASYSSGLVILDLEHFPGGICGTWPAFWMFGPDWPTHGEIDILEGVNTQSANQMTLHTANGCQISETHGAMAGTVSSTDCYAYADGNEGCAVHDDSTSTYSGFNANKGGVFATQVDPVNQVIQIWFFNRSSIPADIAAGKPTMESWGMPRAHFGGCDVQSHFSDLTIVFDNTFCGDWAGNSWSSDDSCASKADSCDDFVANNPAAFKDAYWLINSLKVYQWGTANSTSTNSTTNSTGNYTSSYARARNARPVRLS